jgi:hypothetical protein
MKETMMVGLKERHGASLAVPSSGEPFNSMSRDAARGVGSMPGRLWVSGCNPRSSERGASMSGHEVFVLGVDGKPLTPSTNSKARKLLKGGQAKPVWNKFGQFGIQMLVSTRTETPESSLGVDFGTKFEGYALVVGKENVLSVMWLLPDKKKIVRKLEERKCLRRARHWRNCRRRKCKSDNRSKKGFIAPSQLVIVQSRLKVLNEFFRCFPVDVAAVEDVCFNHAKKRWGKNFSTIEIGKERIYAWVRERAVLRLYKGHETALLREKYGYKKSGDKSEEVFTSHGSDALTDAVDSSCQEHIPEGRFIVVDDTYRPVRRQLHDSQPGVGGLREKYSEGNFKGVRKGSVCEHGLVVGGTKNAYFIRNLENKRISRTRVVWFSHKFKIKKSLNGGSTANSSAPEGSLSFAEIL